MVNDAAKQLQLVITLGATDPAAAERAAHEGLERFPAAHGFHLLLGDLFVTRGEWEEAVYEYQWELLRAGEESPSGILAARRYSTILARHDLPAELQTLTLAQATGRYDARASGQMVATVIRKRGNRFILALYLAENYQNAGDGEAAVPIYRRLLEWDPYFIPSYVQLAGILASRGDSEEAQSLLARARQIDPGHWRLSPNLQSEAWLMSSISLHGARHGVLHLKSGRLSFSAVETTEKPELKFASVFDAPTSCVRFEGSQLLTFGSVITLDVEARRHRISFLRPYASLFEIPAAARIGRQWKALLTSP